MKMRVESKMKSVAKPMSKELTTHCSRLREIHNEALMR